MHSLIREKGGAVRLRSRLDKSGLPFATNPLGGRAGPELAVYYANFDTLTLWYAPALRWRDGLLPQLAALKSAAEEKPQVFVTGPFKWEVMPHGAAGGFAYILRSPVATMLLKRNGACQVTIRAVLLAAVGPDAAVEEMAATVALLRARGKMGERPSPVGVISRADICVDVGMPVLSYSDVECMVSRARIRTAYGFSLEKGDKLTRAHIEAAERAVARLRAGENKLDAATALLRAVGLSRVWKTEAGEVATEHQREAVYRRGQTSSGVSIGAGQLVCRIYDKVLEESITKKGFIKGVWEKSGWRDLWEYTGTGPDGGEAAGSLEAPSRAVAAAELAARGIKVARICHAMPVTRIEFQLRKGALDSFEPIRRGGRRWDCVRPLTGALWGYLTREWLTLRTPTENMQPTRWPLDARWSAVQGIAFPDGRPMRRSSLGRPPSWVEMSIEAERAAPWPMRAGETGDGARVRAEIRRRGMHRPGHRVLRDAEVSTLENLRSQARGLLVSMAAIVGGERPYSHALAMMSKAEDFKERFRVAEARHVFRGAERLAIGGVA